MDSTGISAFLRAAVSLRGRGCLILHGEQQRVGRVLDLVRVDGSIPNLHRVHDAGLPSQNGSEPGHAKVHVDRSRPAPSSNQTFLPAPSGSTPHDVAIASIRNRPRPRPESVLRAPAPQDRPSSNGAARSDATSNIRRRYSSTRSWRTSDWIRFPLPCTADRAVRLLERRDDLGGVARAGRPSTRASGNPRRDVLGGADQRLGAGLLGRSARMRRRCRRSCVGAGGRTARSSPRFRPRYALERLTDTESASRR